MADNPRNLSFLALFASLFAVARSGQPGPDGKQGATGAAGASGAAGPAGAPGPAGPALGEGRDIDLGSGGDFQNIDGQGFHFLRVRTSDDGAEIGGMVAEEDGFFRVVLAVHRRQLWTDLDAGSLPANQMLINNGAASAEVFAGRAIMFVYDLSQQKWVVLVPIAAPH